MKSILTAGTLLAIITVLLIGLYYRHTEIDELQVRLQTVLSGLKTIQERYVEPHRPRIAVGYGACKDVVFDAKDLLEYRPLASRVDIDSIDSVDDLYESYAFYFRHGAAAERYTANSSLFEYLLEKVLRLDSVRTSIGGNAASIAKRLAIEGYDVLLATTGSIELRNMLPQNIKVIGDIVETDDVHLIFEYKSNEEWGPLTAPRANRFILHNDYHNPRLSSLGIFGSHVDEFQPDLLVISGLQMMDNYPMSKVLRESRLKEVSEQMKSQPPSTRIHFEMASITEKVLLSQIFEHVVPYADSLGMNEQELANMHSLLFQKSITLATDSNPRVSKVLDMMRDIFRELQDMRNMTALSRPLTRLHIHTLAYQLIMVSEDSHWRNTPVAVAKASLVANTYVCDTTKVDIAKATLVMDDSFSTSSLPGSRRIHIDDQKPVACWQEDQCEICIAPNLVCTCAKQTAGCGDNISAAGLAVQI